MDKSKVLAILGGEPVRKKAFPVWPEATAREKDNLAKVASSNGWGIFRGSLINNFGEQFAHYHGARYGLPCANGTAALKVQLQALGIGRGDEVITTVFTCVSTIVPIVALGAVPIFVDVKADDYTIDPELIEKKITSKTKAIIAVHLYGSLCDLDKLVEIAKKHNIHLIEDAAEVPGSFWRDKGVGTFGISGSFSFQEAKVMTSGEGGILITDSSEIYELASSYINCGRARPGATNLRKVMGDNLRLTEFQAAVLLSQLDLLKERTDLRQNNASRLSKKLSQIYGISVIKPNKNVTAQAYYYYVFKFISESLGISRETFTAALGAEGIPTRKLFVPVFQDPLFNLNKYDTPEAFEFYQERPLVAEEFPNAMRAGFSEGVAIWHPILLGDSFDLDDIANAIEKIVENIDKLKAYQPKG